MNWGQWFDEVIEKAEQLSLFGALRLKVTSPEPRQIASRPPEAKPSARPKRRLVVPPKTGGAPPGGGWRRTPNGWARGQGDSYEWQPSNWAQKAPEKAPEPEAPKPGTVPPEVVEARKEVIAADEAFRPTTYRAQEAGNPRLTAALDHLYELEKQHGTRPTTARGVREALGVPPEAKGGDWRIAERGAKPANVILLPHDTIMNLRWKGGQFEGYRQYRQYTHGGYWQNVDKKWKPAKELVAKEVEEQAKWLKRVEREHKSRKEQEATEEELQPVVRGPMLDVDTSNLQPQTHLSTNRWEAGLDWAEKVMGEKTAAPHQDTEHKFALALAGQADVSTYIPTPRQYAALKHLEGIASRKLYAKGGQRAGLEPVREPTLTRSKEAFWRGVQAFAAQGIQQWDSGPMAAYVQEFRDYVAANRRSG